MPETLVELNLQNVNLRFLPNLTKCINLQKLNISMNSNIINLNKFQTLPDSIEILIANECNIGEITKFPKNLIIFTGDESKIYSINVDFPSNLKIFSAFDNMLSKVPIFPEQIENINLSDNILEEIPVFPPTTKRIDLTKNKKLSIELLKKKKIEYPDMTILFTEFSSILDLSRRNFMHDFISPKIVSFENYFTESNPHYMIFENSYDV
jgi:hypothetical protein